MNTTTRLYSHEDIDVLDELAPQEHVALMMVDNAELCFEACMHYLNWRPDRWDEIANAFYNSGK